MNRAIENGPIATVIIIRIATESCFLSGCHCDRFEKMRTLSWMGRKEPAALAKLTFMEGGTARMRAAYEAASCTSLKCASDSEAPNPTCDSGRRTDKIEHCTPGRPNRADCHCSQYSPGVTPYTLNPNPMKPLAPSVTIYMPNLKTYEWCFKTVASMLLRAGAGIRTNRQGYAQPDRGMRKQAGKGKGQVV